MADIEGTPEGDVLDGTAGDDIIDGLGGSDVLRGLDGDDVIDGGEGDDHIDTGEGDDIAHGGEGNDTLRGGGDSEDLTPDNLQLYGDGGEDDLSVYLTTHLADTILLDGGADNDRIAFNAWYFDQNLTIRGGGGSDLIDVIGGGAVTIDAGEGDDRIALSYADYAASYALTLGAGADILSIRAGSQPRDGVVLAMHVTDFAPGAGGDRLYLENYLIYLAGWNTALNPFATGHLALVQQGGDAVLRIDRDGGGNGYKDLIVFEGASAAAFTAFNLGWAADGGATAALPRDGTGNADFLLGAGGADLLRGLAGDDEIHGAAGNDSIEGGDGRDQLDGGFGDDVVSGGEQDDRLTDYYGGGERLSGGGGNDLLDIDRRVPDAPVTHSVLDGGDGNDELRFWDLAFRLLDTAVLNGGDGSDYISTGGAASVTIDAGAGDDLLYLANRGTAYTVTLGSGVDRISLESPRSTLGAIRITDFETGANGDRLEIDSYLRGGLTGWDPLSNPYDGGFLRLIQRGADAVLQMDRDGTAAALGFLDLMVFENRAVASFTSLNLGGYSSLLGTEGDETLQGDAGANSLYGFGGADILLGEGGKDSLYGGEGVDRLEGGEDIDRLDGGPGADVMIGGGGNDIYLVDDAGDQIVEEGWGSGDDFDFQGNEVRTGLASFVLPQYFERLIGTAATGQTLTGNNGRTSITAGAGNDFIYLLDGSNFGSGGAGNDRIEGGAGIDTVIGGAGDDRIFGFGGNDLLYAADPFSSQPGNDRIEGGAGNDTIVGSPGNDVLLGGDDDDSLTDRDWGADHLDGGGGADTILFSRYANVAASHSLLLGGGGPDRISLVLSNGGTVAIDAGPGDDLVQAYVIAGSVSIKLGVGNDTLHFDDYLPKAGPDGHITVTDFSVAEDKVDLAAFMLGWLSGWDGIANPFASGHLVLLQDGANALLYADRDGPHGAESPFVFLTFAGLDGRLLGAAQLDGFAPGPRLTEGGGDGESFTGGFGADRMLGWAGDDRLAGGNGDDWLWGGVGTDRLEGGAGADIFAFSGILDSTTARRSDGYKLLPDTIADFTHGEDRIDLSAIDANAATGADDAFAFLGTAAFTGQAGQLRYEMRGSLALILGDVDGDGLADLQILAATPALQAADFIL